MRKAMRTDRRSTKRASNVRKASGFLIVLLITGVAGFGFMFSDDEVLLKIYRGIDVFGKVYKEVSLNYVDEVDPDEFIRAGIEGMLETLDPYTVFIGENEHDEIDLVTNGKYGGIGVTIGVRDGKVIIVGLIEGFSAAKQGLQIGDRIVEVDGQEVTPALFREVRTVVRGTPGSELRMKVEREGESELLEFVLVREEIRVKNVTYAGYVEEGIGYLRLERFSRTAGDDIRTAIKDLRAGGSLRGIVLDLRDNPGGLLDMAVDVTSKFVPENSLIVSTRGRRTESERRYHSNEKPMAPDIPLAILVNGGSASASEIVAGAIQDLDRGVVVGTRTFGKGLVQTITRLTEKSSLKITTARYYTPSGRSIQVFDYAHRDPDGLASVLPDSLKREYRTKNNRKVYEAGGIQPDTTAELRETSRFLDALRRQSMFFGFASRYAARNPSLPDSFEVTDEMIQDFHSYLDQKGFDYREEAEVELEGLRLAAETGRYGEEFHQQLARIERSVLNEKERAFERFENEIRCDLKVAIVGRMKGEKARIEAEFPDDQQLMLAISMLKQKEAYDRILRGPETGESGR